MECGEPLIARKGESRRPHFAHSQDSTCSAESALHKIGKLLVKKRIDQAITSGEDIPLRWNCGYCYEDHQANLMKRARRCELEHSIATARADVALLDANDQAYAALEIVVTHKPEEATRRVYERNNVRLLRFDLKTEDDLIKLTAPEGVRPDFVDHCTMPRCPDCRTYQRQRRLYILDQSCWRCGRGVKLACGHDGDTMMSPEEFAPFEVEAARKHGVVLDIRYSKTTQSRYMANVCPHCNVISGSFFLHDAWPDIDEDKALRISVGCPKCEKVYPT